VVGCSHESSEEILVDEKKRLAYKMDRNEMNLDRPWERIFFGGELYQVNLDVTGSLDHTCMQYHKKQSPISNKKEKEKSTKHILR